MVKTLGLYDLTHSIAGEYLRSFEFPWQALEGIKEWIISQGESLDKGQFEETSPQVWVHKSATVAKSACICPACIIDEGAVVRHCAYLRGGVVVGKNCVVGNSVEIKNSLLFDEAQVPHFNYVGDSVLGYKAHMGAGSITSNVKSDKTVVVIKGEKEMITGRKKVGAMLGDGVEVGCNAVLNPGTVVGKNTTIYPLSFVRGVLPADSIYKYSGEIAKKR